MFSQNNNGIAEDQLKRTDSVVSKHNTIESEIDFLLDICLLGSFEGTRNRMICINPILEKSVSARIDHRDDKCKREFCRICCQINYGNAACNVCN